jgi:group II intron reverse transcriptase/maturase
LWIFSGSVSFTVNNEFKRIKLETLELFTVDHNTKVTTILCNPTDLPESEIDREQEHVGKVVERVSPVRLLQGKIDYDENILTSGAPQNPISHANFTIFEKSGNSSSNVVFVSQIICQASKVNSTRKESTVGLPKGSNSYGDGGLILGKRKKRHSITKVSQRRFSTSTAATNNKYISGEDWLSKLRVRDGKYRGLYKLLCDENFLFGCYHEIKSKPGNMTPGSDNETLDGISKYFFKKLSKSLEDESFQFKPVKRVFIPKANGKMRPLGIPSPRDKILQKAMAIILNSIYEPNFLDSSHGFRPNRSCHTAMAQIAKWSGTKLAIEGDIKGFFDNVDHHILASILEKKIDDQQFLDLYWKLVKAGYVEEGIKRDSLLGVPQGGLISPILSNVYLHEFDLFMESLIEKYHDKRPDVTIRIKEYDKITRKIQTYREKMAKLTDLDLDLKYELNTQARALIKQRQKMTSRRVDGIRLRYVRYADDWIVGLVSTPDFADNIRSEIQIFLKEQLKLELSVEKTKITDLLHDKASFLGFYIMVHKPKESNFTKATRMGVTRKTKISHNRLWLLVPVTPLLEKLANKGFLRDYAPGKKIIPNAITKWIFLDHHSIINRYNWTIRGLLNYYNIATNRYIFHLICNFILRHSCAKTLARKFNLRSRAGAFKNFGKLLNTKDKPIIGLALETNYKRLEMNKWPKRIKLLDPFNNTEHFVHWRLRSQSNFWVDCIICGSEEEIEMHHLKHIRKSNVKLTGFSTIMSRLNRKQIPVCKSCHHKIHTGKYDGINLSKLKKSN